LFFKEFKHYKVFSALACITATVDAKELANERGFYLLKLRDEEYMALDNQENFKAIPC
jgi:hypothetical protein